METYGVVIIKYMYIIRDEYYTYFFFSSRRRHTRWTGDWSSDVCSSDLKNSLYIANYDLDPGLELVRGDVSSRSFQTTDLVASPCTSDSLSSSVRSEERRVGKECISRWSPDYEKNKIWRHTES